MNTQAVGAGSAGAPPAMSEGASLAKEWESLPVVEVEQGESQAASGNEATGGDHAGKTRTEVVVDASKTAAGSAAKPGEQQKDAAAGQADEWAVDQALLNQVLADPKHGGIVKQLHEKYVKAVESVKIWGPEAQEARSLVPGGLSELKETVEVAQSARREAADFASGIPERQRGALEAIAADHPSQFAGAVPLYMEVARKTNPAGTEAYLRGELTRSLEADGVIGALQTVLSLRAGVKDREPTAEELTKFDEAMGQLESWTGKAGFAQASDAAGTARAKSKDVDPELAVAREKLAKYEKQEQTSKAEAFTTWWTPTNKNISESVREEAKTAIDGLLPKNVEANFRAEVMNRYLNEIEQKISEQLRSDLGFQEKLAAVLANEAWKSKGDDARTQYVNLTTARAKQLLPGIIAKTFEPLTKAAVASASSKTEKEKASATRSDVTGQGASARPSKISLKDVKAGGVYASKSDEEILDL